MMILRDVKITSAELMLLVLRKVLPLACPGRCGRRHHNFDFAGTGCNTVSRNSRQHGERRRLEAMPQELTGVIVYTLERSNCEFEGIHHNNAVTVSIYRVHCGCSDIQRPCKIM
jgi:hypothetical protein